MFPNAKGNSSSHRNRKIKVSGLYLTGEGSCSCPRSSYLFYLHKWLLGFPPPHMACVWWPLDGIVGLCGQRKSISGRDFENNASPKSFKCFIGVATLAEIPYTN